MELTFSLRGKSMAGLVGVASGTFGYGTEYKGLVDFSKIGAIYTKAVTPLPRVGNAPPRLVETPSGLINSIGLANVGVEAFLKDKLPALEKLGPTVVVNVAGAVEEDYLQVVQALDAQPGVWGYELNISCPNVKHGGIAFGTNPGMVESLTRSLRDLTEKPLIVKLTPNVTDIADIAKAAEAGGADALTCINTLKGMVIDVRKKKTVLAAGTGGLSGPSILPVGVAMAYRAKRSVKIPIIGLGGIQKTDDALQYLLAGCSAVQVGTFTFVDPQAAEKIHDGIRSYAEENGLKTVEDFHQFLP